MRQSKGTAIFILIVMIVAMPVVFWFAYTKGSDKEKDYLERGKEVTAIVVNGTDFPGSGVTVWYKDDKGDMVVANATVNKYVNTGDRVKGYVLPESPDEFYAPAASKLKIFFFVMIGVVWAGCITALIVILVKGRGMSSSVVKKGIPVKGELLSVGRIGDKVFGKVRFTAPSGTEYVQDLPIRNEFFAPGESMNVLVYEKKPGSCKAEFIY